MIYEKYVEAGKVELIFVDLPLEMHPNAFEAAEAAQCAFEQGLFWEMHHQLFANQRALSTEELPSHAEAIGADVAEFQSCLAGGKQAGGIRQDMRAAQFAGVTSTPAFLLGRRKPGTDKVIVSEVVLGAVPADVLEHKIENLLQAE